MAKIFLGPDEDNEVGGGDARSPYSMQESRRVSIERCIRSLVHACQCRDANCRNPTCMKMKRVLCHMKNCKRKSNGACSLCKQLVALCCYHAKFCQEQKCSVPFCQNIRYRLKQQRMQQRHNQAQMLRRRMAVMQRGAGGGSMQATVSHPNSVTNVQQQHPHSVGLSPAVQQVSQPQSVSISPVIIQQNSQVVSHHPSGGGSQPVYTAPTMPGAQHMVRNPGGVVPGGKPVPGNPHPQSVVRWPTGNMVAQGGAQPGQRIMPTAPGQVQRPGPHPQHRNITEVVQQLTANCTTPEERKMKLEQFLRDNPQLRALIRTQQHHQQQQQRHVQAQQQSQVTLVNMVPQQNCPPGTWAQQPQQVRFRQQQQQQQQHQQHQQQQQQQHHHGLYGNNPAGNFQPGGQRVPSTGGGPGGTLEQLMLANQQQSGGTPASPFPSGLTGGTGGASTGGPGPNTAVVVNAGPQGDGPNNAPPASLQPEQLANFCDKL